MFSMVSHFRNIQFSTVFLTDKIESKIRIVVTIVAGDNDSDE